MEVIGTLIYMRSFIAIEIPEAIKKQMAEAQDRLKGSGVEASWTRPEGIHLTLKFLGEIPAALVPDIEQALSGAVSGRGRFRLAVGGVGAFPNANNARVAWIGLSGDLDPLTRLQEAVEDAMARLGMDRENRAFKPHLTLARVKYIRSRDQWRKALDEIRDIKLPEFEVTGVSLMKSELNRSGAVYTEIAKVELR